MVHLEVTYEGLPQIACGEESGETTRNEKKVTCRGCREYMRGDRRLEDYEGEYED